MRQIKQLSVQYLQFYKNHNRRCAFALMGILLFANLTNIGWGAQGQSEISIDWYATLNENWNGADSFGVNDTVRILFGARNNGVQEANFNAELKVWKDGIIMDSIFGSITMPANSSKDQNGEDPRFNASFTTAGTYQIQLCINQQCKEEKSITVTGEEPPANINLHWFATLDEGWSGSSTFATNETVRILFGAQNNANADASFRAELKIRKEGNLQDSKYGSITMPANSSKDQNGEDPRFETSFTNAGDYQIQLCVGTECMAVKTITIIGEEFDYDSEGRLICPAGNSDHDNNGWGWHPAAAAGCVINASDLEQANDVFGVKKLYQDTENSIAWDSTHWSGQQYSMDFLTDTIDPSRASGRRGTGELVINDGVLTMAGHQPRLYINPIPGRVPWKNTEITFYYQRVIDDNTNWAGAIIGVRSGAEGHSTAVCEAHTYYARLRHDGAVDFAKELMHPQSTPINRLGAETVWPVDGGIPYYRWIGVKFVIINDAEDEVRFELYRDMTEGSEGGTWELVSSFRDTGENWSADSTCAIHNPNADGLSTQAILDGGSVIIRNTGVTEALYKWVSVREISIQ